MHENPGKALEKSVFDAHENYNNTDSSSTIALR